MCRGGKLPNGKRKEREGEEEGKEGAPHFAETTLTPPLGSGPYRIKEVKAGTAISYERVPDYWAQDADGQV